MLRKSTGTLERLETGGPPLGISTEFRHQAGATDLIGGDWLVIFTDGVVEAINAAGKEYEESQLIQVVNDGAAAAPAELLSRLLASLDHFVGNTPQHDDMTCLLLKRSS